MAEAIAGAAVRYAEILEALYEEVVQPCEAPETICDERVLLEVVSHVEPAAVKATEEHGLDEATGRRLCADLTLLLMIRRGAELEACEGGVSTAAPVRHAQGDSGRANAES